MDEQIGKMLSTLAGTHFGKNTLIIYTSDHGEMAGEHRMWWKSSFYQGSVGVPLIFSLPGQFAEGRTISDVTSLLDIGPTLVDLAGGEPMFGVRGRSLKEFLVGYGEVSGWHNTAFAELGGLQRDPPARMIRRGQWKLNYYHEYDQPQLFNLKTDPGEWNDLADDTTYSRIRDELLAEVRAGWSGETVLHALETTQNDYKVLEEFSRNTRISTEDAPDLWTAPDGCNVFPE
jgi:choline-sulfatase